MLAVLLSGLYYALFLFIASLCLPYIAAYFQIFTMLCRCHLKNLEVKSRFDDALEERKTLQ
jgi:hypothetical protein